MASEGRYFYLVQSFVISPNAVEFAARNSMSGKPKTKQSPVRNYSISLANPKKLIY